MIVFDMYILVLYLNSQATMVRIELDARNSTCKVSTFHKQIVLLFNDVLFVPESKFLVNLHMDFTGNIMIQSIDYRLTIEKSKYLLTSVNPRIVDLVTRYKVSDGALNRDSAV